MDRSSAEIKGRHSAYNLRVAIMLPPGTPDGLNRIGIMGAGDFLPRFLLEGLPVGEFRYVKHHLFLNVQEVAREAEQVYKVLQREGGPSGQ